MKNDSSSTFDFYYCLSSVVYTVGRNHFNVETVEVRGSPQTGQDLLIPKQRLHHSEINLHVCTVDIISSYSRLVIYCINCSQGQLTEQIHLSPSPNKSLLKNPHCCSDFQHGLVTTWIKKKHYLCCTKILKMNCFLD